MKLTQFAFCVFALLCAAIMVAAQTVDFNKDKAGESPKGFSTALTGQGKAGVWVVTKDEASPNQGNTHDRAEAAGLDSGIHSLSSSVSDDSALTVRLPVGCG